MAVNYRPNSVDSCVILAEVEGQKITFNVGYENIESCMETIRDVFDNQCRVYISGFDLVSKNANMTPEDILKRIRKNRPNTNTQENNKTLLLK